MSRPTDNAVLTRSSWHASGYLLKNLPLYWISFFIYIFSHITDVLIAMREPISGSRAQDASYEDPSIRPYKASSTFETPYRSKLALKTEFTELRLQ